MAKDRFSNQKKENYSKDFRWGNSEYTPSKKCNLVFSREQKIFIGNILENNKTIMNSWEKDFLITLYNSAKYSKKQKEILEKIIKNLNKQ